MKDPFEKEFLSIKDQLSSFVFRLVTNRQDTEDIVHETYIKVHDNIDTFQNRSSFKTWVFTIALNTAKNHLAKQKRWKENAQKHGAMLHMNSKEHWDALLQVFNSTPEQEYSVKEHLVYCFNCMNKTLAIEQQICLWLKEVYDFKLKEIMEITGLSEGKVKHAIANARKTLTEIFDKRCAIVNQTGVCNQCSELTGLLNPKQKAQEKINELQLSKQKNTVSKERLLDLRIELAKSIDPLHSNNTLVTSYLLENSEGWVEESIKRKLK